MRAHGLGLLRLAPFVFSFIVIENAVLAVGLCACNKVGRWWQLLRFLLVLTTVGIQTTQFYSLYYSSDFLEAGAMAHAGLALLLVNGFTLGTLALLVGGMSGSYLWFDRKLTRFGGNWRASGLPALTAIFVCAGLMVSNKHISAVQETKVSYRAGHESGIAAFVKTVFGFRQEMSTKSPAVDLNADDLQMAEAMGLYLDPSKEFPFKKVSDLASSQLERINGAPNVIVFFVESLSADLVGVYHDKWAAVTPHINEFASDALTIDQYHNHVTPTIVGLRGQLCSNYPSISHTVWAHAKFKLDSGEMRCLPHILNEHGYETTYLGYAQPNETFFAEQMLEMGFRQTSFYEEFLGRYLKDERDPGLGLKGNSDEQMLKGLVNYLQEKEKDQSQPFFVGLSTVETHPGMDVSDLSYAFQGAESKVLNVVHNFDRVFGDFLTYFKRSPFAKNTIIILTADHSQTPSVELREVASQRYQDDMFNETTMMIYDPFRALHGRKTVPTTSVDFAPTVLDLLSLDHVDHAFMGRSLFEPRAAASLSAGLAFQGRLFVVKHSGERTLERLSLEGCATDMRRKNLCAIYRILRYSQYITEQKRLWAEK